LEAVFEFPFLEQMMPRTLTCLCVSVNARIRLRVCVWVGGDREIRRCNPMNFSKRLRSC